MARIGIRREDKSRWERRSPLTPTQVQQITGRGIEVKVQSSAVRIFTDSEYQHAGAAIHESLSDCPLVFGVKEIPPEKIEPGTSYVFFSHTHKGQPSGMPLLKTLIERKCTLIDYEIICNEKGQRLIFFGRYAGLAGMLDTFWAFGKRLEAEGRSTPFAFLRRAFEYHSLDEARKDVGRVAREIARNGLPADMSPFVCGFSGYGRVSMGAQEIFDLLPVREITPDELNTLASSVHASSHFVYKTVFHEEHMYRRRHGAARFSFDEFIASPELYEPIFEPQLAHLDLLIHGIYWEPRFPKLITREALQAAWSHPHKPRLRVIGDITCDIRGSIACTIQPANQDHPTYIYDPVSDTAHVDLFDGNGPLVLAVDNLPCELPRDASDEFGQALTPFIVEMARAHGPKGLDPTKLPDPIRNAIIVLKGALTPDHQHLAQHLPA